MSSDGYPNAVAISRISEDGISSERQNERAIKWLIDQPGGSIVVVTPQKNFEGESLKKLVAKPRVTHLSWRGLSAGSLAGHRVLLAWPDRQRLNDLWGVEADALVVIEFGKRDTADWISEANPTELSMNHAVQPTSKAHGIGASAPLPNGVDGILEHIASMAAGYSSGLKWNEEDMLKADMMNCPNRWVPITVEQVRAKCRELGMRPNDIDTIAGYLQRRKDGRRFNVRSSYRDFRFN
jgi:hypothetical protein